MKACDIAPSRRLRRSSVRQDLPWKRIWRLCNDGNCPEDLIQKLRSRKKVRVYRKRVDAEIVNKLIVAMPLRNRKTHRSAVGLGIGPTASWRDLKRSEVKRSSATLKPVLSAQNMTDRLKWCLGFVLATQLIPRTCANM